LNRGKERTLSARRGHARFHFHHANAFCFVFCRGTITEGRIVPPAMTMTWPSCIGHGRKLIHRDSPDGGAPRARRAGRPC
jgi:hypothetical protein